MNATPEEMGLFRQAWWLDAVAGPGKWGEAQVCEGGRVVARLPYAIERRFGMTLLTMPPFTQTLGPWLAPLAGKAATVLGRQHELLGKLIKELPPHHYFAQNFHPDMTNWLPWHWEGFRQTSRYTYMLEGLHDDAALLDGLLPRVRSELQKARNRYGLTVRTDLSVEEFIRLNESVYKRQGISRPYSADTVRRMDSACVARGQRQMFCAQDPQGRVHAAVYIVWDQRRAYYLMSGYDPEFRGSGAGTLALWEAIRFAATVSAAFDFEGSMMQPVEHLIRGFGARQVPYSRVWRAHSRLLGMATHVRDAWHDLRRRR